MDDLLLHIHTATETAVIGLQQKGKLISSRTNGEPKQHAIFLHEGINQLLRENAFSPNDIKAVMATNGPGSYTGIRVGLAAAKGLCFALDIPLITCNTLEALALTAIIMIEDNGALYCPMIDARRMEVYTGLYDSGLKKLSEPEAMVLDENSFAEEKDDKRILFFGSGSHKFSKISRVPGGEFIDVDHITAEALVIITWERYQQQRFDNLAYSEPAYLKMFYTPGSK